MDAFVEDMQRFAPSFVVDLGDRIMEVDVPADRRHTLDVRDRLRQVKVPVFHLMGNHDVANLPKASVCRLLGMPAAYHSAQVDGYTCLFLDSTDPIVGEYGGRISDAQLAWLEAELAMARWPVVVFCHHPLDEQPIETNPLFRDHPEWSMVENRKAVRDLLAQRGNVVAVVTGHVHWNRASCSVGIPFLTIQGLVETWTTGGVPAGAYGKLSFSATRGVELVVEGRDAVTVQLPVPCPDGRIV